MALARHGRMSDVALRNDAVGVTYAAGLVADGGGSFHIGVIIRKKRIDAIISDNSEDDKSYSNTAHDLSSGMMRATRPTVHRDILPAQSDGVRNDVPLSDSRLRSCVIGGRIDEM